VFNPIAGEFRPIARDYGIDEKTCRALGIKIVPYAAKQTEPDGDGGFEDVFLPKKACVSFDYHDAKGGLWGQKIRYKISEDEKTYSFPHAAGKPPLWLMHLWGPGCDTRNMVIFEGEGDAAAYYQMTGGKYPVTSLPTGAKGCVDVLKDHYEFLSRFDKIVLIFDGDPTGREWVQKAAEVLPAGKAHIGEVYGHKDARTALMAGDGKAITNAFFNAEKFRPQGIFRVRDLIEDARRPVEMGIPWWSPTLTKWTYGRRPGELYVLGAGNSIGKTDWTTQSISFDALVLGIMTAVIYLEQPPVETLKRLAGKFAGKPFHIPMEEGEYTQEELDAALDALEQSPNLIFGGSFASTEWEEVKAKIRYLAIAEGVRVVYLDNMTALIDESNERASVEKIIKEMALLCQELGINIILLCHLATPDGKSHEEGGQVSLKHFKGSRAMGAWPHYAFGLERNTQHPDPAMRNYSTFRCVKDRYTGRANGNTMCLRFERETGQLVECEFPVEAEGGGASFEPYTGTDF
jgi:twinkle protein